MWSKLGMCRLHSAAENRQNRQNLHPTTETFASYSCNPFAESISSDKFDRRRKDALALHAQTL